MSKPTTSLTEKARDIVNTYAISVFIHAGLGANTDLARTQNVRDVVSPGSSRKVFMMSWTLTGILPVGGAYT